MTDMDAKAVAHESLYGSGNPGDQYFNMTRYLEDSARTASGNFHNELAPPAVLLDAIAGVKAVSPQIDAIKKALFYGKPNDDLAFAASFANDKDYGNANINILHAILGIYTEAAELLEILEVILRNKGTFLSYEEDGQLQKDLLNEAGDGLWYNAMLFRELKTDFEKVAGLNIEKLKKRFPVKFTEDLAVNRDEAKENVVFE